MFKCIKCSKKFVRSDNLKRHSKTHNNCEAKSILKCPVCAFTFNRLDALKRHQLKHSNFTNFTCDSCNATFSRKDNLLRHFKFQHETIEKKTTESSIKSNERLAESVRPINYHYDLSKKKTKPNEVNKSSVESSNNKINKKNNVQSKIQVRYDY